MLTADEAFEQFSGAFALAKQLAEELGRLTEGCAELRVENARLAQVFYVLDGMIQTFLQVVDQGGAGALLRARLTLLEHEDCALAGLSDVLGRLMQPAAEPSDGGASVAECTKGSTHPLLESTQVLKVEHAHAARLSGRKRRSDRL